ncbi:hypothetical protein DK847_20145, partial [Aestuariivirga litoralis]
RAAAPTPRSPGVTPPLGGAPRPKFSFADDSRAEPPRPGLSAPLTPPRPALGGERAPPPFLRPGSGANGSLGARPQPAFRPTSTEGGSGYVAPPRLQPPAAPRPGLGSDAAGYGTSRRTPALRPPALDPYARQPQPEPREREREYIEDEFEEEGRTAPRLGRPAPVGRGRVQDDYDEVFEDEQPQRSRASARDYQAAYDEGEEGFADEPVRRSSGPWLLLAALLVAAVLTGVVVWYYSDSLRNIAGSGASSGSGTTPVVTAPADPAKVAAPDATGGEGQTEAPAARKKQIYDRIVGEQEVTGEMQPTEETPVPPEAPPANADQVPKVEPQGNANPIPAPDAATQGTGLPEVEPPPPLPIPGADGADGQQGNLGLKGGSQVAATSAQPDLGGTAAPPPMPGTTNSQSTDASTPPPPEKATDGAALVSGAGAGAAATAAGAAAAGAAATAAGAAKSVTDTAAVVTPQPDTQITPPAPVEAASEPEPAPAPPPKKKTATKKTTSKTAAKQTDYNNLGSKPVVLVPPSQQGGGESAASTASTAPIAPAPSTADQAAATAPAQQKRKTIFDLFNGGTSTNIPVEEAAPTQVASAPTQTKQATAPAAQPKAAAPASTGGGYVVQLASFRTDMEAKQEYSRLAGAYPAVVGSLKSQIRQTNVGGSPRYQLALGPLPTRGDATRVCGELIAAGESDCIVRGP